MIGDVVIDLTGRQRRKPLLGSGAAVPVGFSATWTAGFSTTWTPGTLLIATDGLFKYAPARRVAEIARGADLAAAAEALVEQVRLPSGGLQDDVAVVLCRRSEAPPTRVIERGAVVGWLRRRAEAVLVDVDHVDE